jgi:hypothetical protein
LIIRARQKPVGGLRGRHFNDRGGGGSGLHDDGAHPALGHGHLDPLHASARPCHRERLGRTDDIPAIQQLAANVTHGCLTLIGTAIAGLVSVHIASALFHHFVRKDRVRMRMVSG